MDSLARSVGDVVQSVEASEIQTVSLIEVAIPRPLWQSFTYRHKILLRPGVRVRVPFGKGEEIGVVLSSHPIPPKTQGNVRSSEPMLFDSSPSSELPFSPLKEKKPPAKSKRAGEGSINLKNVKDVIDEEPVYSTHLISLGRWMADYYIHPLGEVLRTMLPSGAARAKKSSVSLTSKIGEVGGSLGLADANLEILKICFSKKNSISVASLKNQLGKSGIGASQINDWLERGYLELTEEGIAKARAQKSRKKLPPKNDQINGERESEHLKAESPKVLTLRQEQVKASILTRWGDSNYKCVLLFGVTGAGKTEIYLQMIAASQRQALVLVPEIALTPQMTAVFERRFPGQVSVVHSAMTDAVRWDQLIKIKSNQARILIGPRSAVFANFSDLGLIIVDEEHDSSYKQTSGLCYQGRDVAVVRAQMENIPIVLGSATPSMESWHNAQTGKYFLERLEERVGGRQLPSVDFLKIQSHLRRGVKLSPDLGVNPVSNPQALEKVEQPPIAEEVFEAIAENLAKKQQTIVLVNRRGYAYYLFDMNQAEAVQCPKCSISLTIHSRSTQLHCHYCAYRTTVNAVVNAAPGHQFVAIGYGSEKAFDILSERFPEARLGRLDSDIASDRQILTDTLDKFRHQQLDILVGTQILAKGHDFPNVTLMILLEVDQLLNLPDFRASERTFQLLVQAAGRAGRHELTGKVLVQTTKGLSPVLEAGLNHDYPKFVESEISFRKAFSYPPFSRIISIELSSTDRDELENICRSLEKWVNRVEEASGPVRFLGPSSPAIEMIRGRHRKSLILMGPQASQLNIIARKILHDFSDLRGDMRLRIDVDPSSLL